MSTRRKLISRSELREEVRAWAERIGAKPSRVHIQAMRTKWASCSPLGRVTLSAELLREDRGFRDYVIAHELVHLLVPNHGKVFKALMNIYVPSWSHLATGRASRRCGYAEV